MHLNKPQFGKLVDLLNEGSRKAQSTGSDVLVSYSQEFDAIDPLVLFSATEGIASERWYWEHPEGGRSLTSVGALVGTTPPRNVRFQEIDRTLKQYASRATIGSDGQPREPGPKFFSAFSFDPEYPQDRLVWQGFPSTYLLTPRLTLVRNGTDYTLTINILVSARMEPQTLLQSLDEFFDEIATGFDRQKTSDYAIDELPPDDAGEKEIRQFANTVVQAEGMIRRGELDIASVTRRRKLTTSGLYRVRPALEYLRGRVPHSRIVAAGRHGSTFLGYSDATLIGKDGDGVHATCTIGSTRRGNVPQLDSALAAQLLDNGELLEFHDECVEHLFTTFDQQCSGAEAPDEPELKSTEDRHHLYSSITARARQETSLLKLLDAIHPSVEVSGLPVSEAKAFIRQHEPVDRGWLGAPFGWIDLEGNGAFVAPRHVAVIRAPVLEQQRAYLFTTTIVTSGADPEDKLAETDRELEPLRAALRQ